MVLIAFKAYADNDWSDDGIAVAIVDVTPGLLARIGPIAQAARRLDARWHGQLLGIEVFDLAAVWYGEDLVSVCELADAEFSDNFHEQGWAHVPAGVDVSSFEPQRTELERVECGSNAGQPNVCWRCRPKHTQIEIETMSIELRELQRLARVAVPNPIRSRHAPLRSPPQDRRSDHRRGRQSG